MNKNLHTSFITRFLLLLITVIMSTQLLFAAPTDVKIVKCYPNPATSVINFEFKSGQDKFSVLQIYSFSGKKMANIPLSSSKLTIPLDNEYYRGIYIFRLTDKNGKILETGKFQVVK